MMIQLSVAIVAGLAGAVLGGLGGCLYAGNHAIDCEFLGVRGYEAGAAVGAIAGFALAGLAGFLLARCIPRSEP